MVAGKRVALWLFLPFVAVLLLTPTSSASATTVCDPAVETCPDPTGSPSPAEPSTPVTEPSPSPSPSPDPTPVNCSTASPCPVSIVLDEPLADWLTGVALAVAVLLAAVLAHVVGSWRR